MRGKSRLDITLPQSLTPRWSDTTAGLPYKRYKSAIKNRCIPDHLASEAWFVEPGIWELSRRLPSHACDIERDHTIRGEKGVANKLPHLSLRRRTPPLVKTRSTTASRSLSLNFWTKHFGSGISWVFPIMPP